MLQTRRIKSVPIVADFAVEFFGVKSTIRRDFILRTRCRSDIVQYGVKSICIFVVLQQRDSCDDHLLLAMLYVVNAYKLN